ncbi:MAG TPA: uroporphyrinogen-III C-methyltransferase [Vicinamibacterales bacterium]|nr:uroporphyrinogen-III C-methyltransferase [Vicinamibacterales bacterium]
MIRPIVYIIGTGPGDPSLISTRGARYLAAADVVLYDRLVNPRLLRYPRLEAEKIDVGLASPQALDQEAINYLLVEKAREGKIVARLKWGDPFLFDRGGQEALFLHEHGIPFEVVPGIPAAIGTTSYAGVPLTYPGGGDSVTFVRGHEDESSTAPNVDWGSLARLGGTLVCYTGPRQLNEILSALLSNGFDPDTPAAIIYDGTFPTQRTTDGTLQELAEMKNLRTKPAILVVGRVVGLRQHLRWFDERPLFGKKIVVTRSREQAGDLVDMLESLGAEPIEAPMIRVEAPDDYGPLDKVVAEAGSYDWIIFTSANGVDYFMRRLLSGDGDIRDLKGVKLVAIGPATADRLARQGLRVDLEPAESRAEAIVHALTDAGPIKGKKFLLPRADIAREVLPDELRKAGADVTEVVAYRTVLAEIEREGDPDIYRMLLEKRIDVVTFTSASTVKNFVQIFGADQSPDLLNATKVASIGPVTAEAAEQYGIKTAIMPKEYTIPALVQAIVDHFRQP